MTLATPKTYTAEEYLALEVESELRHEYCAGEIVEMTGGTPNHNEIIANLIFLLKMALRQQPYSIFVTDQRLWIPEHDVYTYPDVMVTSRPPELKSGRKDTVINPIVIAETLSRSTQNYDRSEKFVHYRTIASFQEYVLIDQYRPFVEHHVKQSEHQWLLTEYQGLDAAFSLMSVPVEIALADLYEGIEFESADTMAPSP
ncbi:Uma2 family endonuclease [Leptothoe sp. PORK10 BA2]|uniref:Uma2 family endonuclease n=1 Tax=Leptothoe sp. PORK10 BA2 TaxID=3110254 RepID=UPI002B207DAB|nr:Uma2 family endonuclease [Leptothoe sp. PORK10 BA2]MEA5466916.1 Uma2 family endonuclease [Leptothoe sp. PORK10 BA2]